MGEGWATFLSYLVSLRLFRLPGSVRLLLELFLSLCSLNPLLRSNSFGLQVPGELCLGLLTVIRAPLMNPLCHEIVCLLLGSLHTHRLFIS